MSLFQNLAKKWKSTSTFNYLTSWLTTPSKQWNADDLKNNIKDLLIQLDFNLQLSETLSEMTIQSFANLSSITPDQVKKSLITTLETHYSKNTSFKKNNSCNLENLINWTADQNNIFFVLGSNGVGKTSFIAKLTYYLKSHEFKNKKILLVASDTFRAGAVKQLEELAQKLNVDVIMPRGKEHSGSLIYRTIKENSNYDLIIFDSSGRQYNNQNLLLEIKKQYSIMLKLLNRTPEEIFLIVDSTLGVYSHSELEKILDIIPITGLVLTKMDSTTRGGAIYNLKPKFSMPIKFICYGEQAEDIELFDISNVTTQLIENVFSDDLLKT